MTLKARFWKEFEHQDRLNAAADRPFRSLHVASGDNGSGAVTALQQALQRVANNSVTFVPFAFVPDISVDGMRWGPYDISEFDLANAHFGVTTQRAVIKFQRQAWLDPDGKAGMITLTQIDKMLKHLQNLAPVPPTPPSPWEDPDL